MLLIAFERPYLWRTLEAFGFCQDCIDKLKVLYDDVESVLKKNGRLCTLFRSRIELGDPYYRTLVATTKRNKLWSGLTYL